MHFNRAQDLVHPVTTVFSDGKLESISLSRKAFFLAIVAILSSFLLIILVTFILTKSGYQVEPEPETEFITNPITKTPVVPSSPSMEEMRLPMELKPTKYELTIQTHLPGYKTIIENGKNFTFDAEIVIHFVCYKKTRKIVINTKELRILNGVENYRLKRKNASNGYLPLKSVDVNETLEMIIFESTEEFHLDEHYTLAFNYSGPISTLVLSGLYLGQYKDEDDLLRYLAITQMEPTAARRMVPCFDEPAMKANWKLKIIHPEGSTALSNGKEMQSLASKDGKWIISEFEETLKMSSYLLAIVVCDFEYIEGHTKNHTRFRIWARKSAKHQTSYALEAGIKALEFFEKFYDISFPLKKIDMIGLPDFQSGAMENWGLITYREANLFYDPTQYSLADKRKVAVIVAHELAHQWFGNLVTMKWWDDLWLNEGFASYMEYLGTDHINNGSFHMENFFILDSFTKALSRDQRATSHPLFYNIDSMEKISEVFDTITYDKGGSILRMIDHLIGRENFRKGLNIYLNKFMYSNADHVDLWNALSQAIPDTVKDFNGNRLNLTDFAASWTEQMGYPVVEMKRNETQVILTQRRFKLDEKALESKKYRKSKFGYKWDIPIWYTINEQKQPMKWLRDELIISVQPDDLLLMNVEVCGFYRVNYDESTWKQISETLQTTHESIPLVNRAQLLADAFTLAEANQLSYTLALSLTSYLTKETEFFPWDNALAGLLKVQYYYIDESENGNVQEYLIRKLSHLYERLSWKNLPHSYTNDSRIFQDSTQGSVLKTYCKLGDSNCRNNARRIFKDDYLSKCNGIHQSSKCSKVPLSIRKLVYCEGISENGIDEWNFLFEMYKKERFQLEKIRLMAALTCIKETWILKRLLDMAVEGKYVRKQDAYIIFYFVSSSNRQIVWDYLQSKWDEIYESFYNTKLLSNIVRSCTEFKNEHKIRQFEQFIDLHANVSSKMAIFNIQLEKAYSNKRWMDKHYKSLATWFEQQNESFKK